MRRLPSDSPEQLKFGLSVIGIAGVCLVGYALKHYFVLGVWDFRILCAGIALGVVAYLAWKFVF